MTRSVVVVLVSLALVASASAEPLLTWGYEVRTTVAPAQVLGSGVGLPGTETVLLEKVLPRPLTPPVNLPDPTTWQWDDYSITLSNELLVTFFDAAGWRTYDYATWGVTWAWEKEDTPDGLVWKSLGETDRRTVRWGQNFGGAQRGNRYDLSVDEFGSLTLSMTPDQLNPNFVPEPATVVLAGVGLAGVLAARFRRRTGR
jgi:hypothetical protein